MNATRDGFGKKLLELGYKENVIVLSADLSSPTKTNGFRQKYPERFFELGIAENNMIGIASGLAEYRPNRVIISSFAAFLTGKYESIRTSVGYSKSPVILVGTHSGLAIGRDGVTQMGLEDVSLMRSIPDMIVLQPATSLQSEKITEFVINNDLTSPVYIRLGRQPCIEIFDESYVFDLNSVDVLEQGDDITLFTTGCILSETIKASAILKTNGINSTVVNITTIKPLNIKKVMEHSKNKKLICVIEDHSIIGGLGSAVCETLSENLPTKVIRIGLNDVFPESGASEDLWEKYDLTGHKIASKIMLTLK
jgi:transketolase